MILDLNDKAVVDSMVYHNMAYCFNKTCPKASTCFRYIAAKFKSSDLLKGNAIYPDALQEGGKCNYFLRPRIIKAAWGFHTLYDKVKRQDVETLRIQVTSFLGGKTSYYRYHRGEKLLSPEQQEYIKTLFAAKGYETPSYGHCKEMFDLTNEDEEYSSKA